MYRHSMSRSRLHRTKLYFFVIAILMTFTIIVLSYQWNTGKRVYKITSRKTNLHIGNVAKSKSDLGTVLVNSEPTLQGTITNGKFDSITTDPSDKIYTWTLKSFTNHSVKIHNITEASKAKPKEQLKQTIVVLPSDIAESKEKIMLSGKETDLEIPPTHVKKISQPEGSNIPKLNPTHQRSQTGLTEQKANKESTQNTRNIRHRNPKRRTLIPQSASSMTATVERNISDKEHKVNKMFIQNTSKIRHSDSERTMKAHATSTVDKNISGTRKRPHHKSRVQKNNWIIKHPNNGIIPELSSYNNIRHRPNEFGRKISNNIKLVGSQDNLRYIFQNYNGEQAYHPTVRPEECESCFNIDFKNMINEETICKSMKVNLMILITSVPTNTESRAAIRETWGQACVNSESNTKCAFVFGNRNNSADNQLLISESEKHHDILQFDFKDTYANLTYKTMVLLKWSHNFCSEAKFVMKTDDDMWINTDLLPVLLQAAPDSGFLGGCCWGASRPHRDETSKWHVPFHMFTKPLYPPMCSGTAYIATPDVIDGILRVSPNIPYFYLEDVYVALCLKEIGISPKKLEGFSNMLSEYRSCDYRNRYLTSHSFSASELRYIWELSHECPKQNMSPDMLYFATTLVD